jgi:hypothetical protein
MRLAAGKIQNIRGETKQCIGVALRFGVAIKCSKSGYLSG